MLRLRAAQLEERSRQAEARERHTALRAATA
jgi:hypothetical protein